MAVQESRLVISIDARNAERTAKALNSELQGITDNGAKAENQINAMGGSLKALAGYMGGILTIGSAISMADGYTQMAARIRNATSSAEEYELVQERILATANGTYRSLSEAQEVYLSLAGGMKSLGKTTADTLDVADSLSYAFVANAARADQAQSAMDALSKSMAKGKIDADAWISIVSAADNVIADMAKTTGKTEAEIRKLGAEGKASLTDLLETLKATRDTNKQLADNMENSVADGFQKLTNSVTVYLGKLNETSGATGVIASALGGLGDNIDKVAVAGGILASVMAGRVASGYAAATIAAIANTSATAASAGAMATATAAARALYIALGGPVGLAVTVAGAAASYLLLSNNAKDNTKSLRENNESVKDAISAYNQLDAVQKRAQLAKEKSDLKELSDSYENLTSKLNTNAYALSRHNDFTQAQSKEVNALIVEFKRTGDLDKFSASINKLSYVSQDSKDKFNALAGQVRTSGNEYKNQKQFVDAMTNSLNQNAAAGDNAARGIRNAAEAVAEYTGKLKQQKWDLEFTNAVIDKHGKSAREADLLLQAYRENEKKGIKGVTIEQKELIKGIVAEEKAAQKRLESQRASASASKKAQSEADKARKKQENDNNRLIEQQAQLRDSIKDTYDTEFEQIERRENAALSDLAAAGFKPDEFKKYSEIIKNEYQAQRDEYLKNLSIELNEYTWTEDYKLDYAYKNDKAILENSNRTNGVIKDRQLKYLDERYAYEKAQLELNKETRMFQMKEAFLSETDAMNQRYALEEKRIMQIRDIEEREFALKMNRLKQEEEQRKKLQDAQIAWGRTQADMGGYNPYVELSNQRFDRIGQRQNLFDQQMNQLDIQAQDPNADHKRIAEERKAIALQLQVDLLEIEKEFQRQSTLLNLSYGQQITGSFADIFKNIAGEQSNGYKLMFTAQKAFAIASSMIAIKNGIAQAFSLPFPLNLAAAATVAAQTASLVSDIKAVKEGGFKDGGYTGNMGKNQVAGVVHGQEYVLNAEATKRVGRGTLDALNNGGTLDSGSGVNVIINVPQGYKAVQTQSENGVTIDIVENMINQSWGNVNRPNSNESRAIQGAFGIAPKR